MGGGDDAKVTQNLGPEKDLQLQKKSSYDKSCREVGKKEVPGRRTFTDFSDI